MHKSYKEKAPFTYKNKTHTDMHEHVFYEVKLFGHEVKLFGLTIVYFSGLTPTSFGVSNCPSHGIMAPTAHHMAPSP